MSSCDYNRSTPQFKKDPVIEYDYISYTKCNFMFKTITDYMHIFNTNSTTMEYHYT